MGVTEIDQVMTTGPTAVSAADLRVFEGEHQ